MLKLMHREGSTLTELMIVVAIIGILAVIATPSFIKFQARSKQSEVMSNLNAVFTANRAYRQGNGTYGHQVNAIGFTPERGNRYSYDLGGGVWQDRPTSGASQLSSETGVEAETFKWGTTNGIAAVMTAAFPDVENDGNVDDFAANAAGNIDDDTTLDQWSIPSSSRVGETASTSATCSVGSNPVGEPCNDVNDI